MIRKVKGESLDVFEVEEFTLINDCFKNVSNAQFGFSYKSH